MTKEEIIEMAREAGGYYSKKYPDEWRLDDDDLVRFAKLIAEKSKQEQGEPVAFKCGDAIVHIKPPIYGNTKLQTKEWVGLTKEDADSIECWFREEIENDRFSVQNLISRIEAKLKDKNHVVSGT